MTSSGDWSTWWIWRCNGWFDEALSFLAVAVYVDDDDNDNDGDDGNDDNDDICVDLLNSQAIAASSEEGDVELASPWCFTFDKKAPGFTNWFNQVNPGEDVFWWLS